MKAIPFFILAFLFVISSCGTHNISDNSGNNDTIEIKTSVKINIEEFKKLDETKQAEYINKLPKNEQMQYIANFFEDAVIFMPPNDWVKFEKNGNVTYHHSISPNANIGTIGKWKFIDGMIEINSVGDGKSMNDIFGATSFKWKNVKAEAPQNTNPSILELYFDEGYLLQYMKSDQKL